MSLWRKEASKRLPELQRIIASRDVDNPMMLWIELQSEFQKLCEQKPQPVDLIRRVWGYAKWCLEHEDGDVVTGVALGFCEHLLDSEAMRRTLPEIMNLQDYKDIKGLLLYHNSEEEYAEVLKLFENR